MLNIEKYIDWILELGGVPEVAVTKSGKLTYCNELSCDNCMFVEHNCNLEIVNWLASEYQEKPEVTEAEYYFCKIIKYGRLFKDKNGDVHWSPGEAGDPGVYITSAVRTLGVFTENLKFNYLNTGRENAIPIRELIEIYEAAHDIKS